MPRALPVRPTLFVPTLATMPRVVLSTGVSFGAKMSTPCWPRPPDRGVPHELAIARGDTCAIGLGRCSGGGSVHSVQTNQARSMAGRAYGSQQEKEIQSATVARRYQNDYEFAQIVERAGDAIDDSFDVNRKPGSATQEFAVKTAGELRRIAGELDKAQVPDDRASPIKARLIQLINERAKAFEQAKSESTVAAAIASNREAFDAVFEEFSDWEKTVIEEFKQQRDR